ncbi:Vi polysaccharide biosynthesis UDP-N-acetylglucosamine C-6 dehydrogenase TviB [Roseobacter ponti]|uniref:Vi polysaccharide biosynthesis UDP-N-acetylglucosamine C-6 dehydrogenase TviB n=1 Tax=Roseobacter ponti TaxID=1891787 RepID=A0A858SV04_9RHOB|nr:Vi polysaccharide biosynthesis UDP-N-acetylglucosamine C-6 dehydrogenase TviB [Roseobacter ponti]QJF51818.1 Vi polysaccharide biosynthesis UDP-N-acetylglucosamine C-6 dehydrogenase TviB [Roseobacter ponti]
MHSLNDLKPAVIGLGYVGLPVAVEFGRTRTVTGFDINAGRIAELQGGIDRTREVETDDLRAATGLRFTTDESDLEACNTFIVTVPTPVDDSKRPDLSALRLACHLVGRHLSQGDIVIFESTVYPGATEEVCVPVLEEVSGLTFNTGFYAGYSPERINPGDKKHRLPDIRKVTSGSTPQAAALIDALYATIITAGTYQAESIRVAEAAKVIENTQRDLNIALVNELAMIFRTMDIDTEAVLRAAGTKWNFLPFRPGLVGGHCIGVDPYYLTHKAQEMGYHPEIILAGRRLNDSMGKYVAGELIKAMLRRGLPVHGGRVLVMGLTFKENCPDMRNTRVVDVIRELGEFGAKVDVTDPWVSDSDAAAAYGITLVSDPEQGAYDAVILAVAHDVFRKAGPGAVRSYAKAKHVFFDLKSVFPPSESDLRL